MLDFSFVFSQRFIILDTSDLRPRFLTWILLYNSQVSYPLSKFLAIVAKRSANNSNSDDSRSSSSSSSGHSNSTHDGSLYGCQIPLAGSGAPSLASGGCGNGALRQALAAGARACVPEWAAVALAAADAAIEATAASATTTRGNGDDDDECDDEESEAGADSSSSSGALSSINAWLCAGLTESESSSGTAAMMRTEAHFDGYHNLMCVELRRAKLRSAF